MNNKLPEIEDEVSLLQQEIALIDSRQLHEIVTRGNIDSIFSITSTDAIGRETTFNEIKGSEYFDLLKYFIRNGYIDETYSDYMTYFYENSLSRIDKTFLRSITDKKAKDYTYKLKNPQLVVSRLKLTDFDQEEVLNFDNLKLILQQVYGIENENAISHKNYTQILTQPNSPLAQYIDENISEYLDVILLASNGTIFDDESAALSILNNTDVTTEQKHAYIETLRIAIVSIKMVNDISLWKPLLNNGIAMCSEENIMEYFCAIKSLDKIIIDFINSCRTVLDFTEVLSSYGDEKAEELFDAVTICNSLKNQKYKQILVSLGFMYEYFDISNIFNEKLVILIDENIIKMNPKTLDFIRKNYGSQVLYFIQKHLGEYTEMMTTDLFSVEELIEILSWDIADEIKIGLLKFTNEAISIIGKNYTPAVCMYILGNNFMEENLIELFSSFDEWNDSVQNKN